jgi:uncharacterized protein (DUF3820 family)
MNALKVKATDFITFGKYKGKTFDEIADIDPDYILWIDENVKDVKLPKKWIECVEMDIRERNSELHDILAEHAFDIY